MLATQLERVGRGIEEIASLRDEIRELRASIENLVQQVGASLDAEQGAIRDALPQLTPKECANYFTACGYEPE